MSGKAMRYAENIHEEQPELNLTIAEYMVLQFIAKKINAEFGYAYITKKKMASKMPLSERYLKDVIRSLTAKGIIHTEVVYEYSGTPMLESYIPRTVNKNKLRTVTNAYFFLGQDFKEENYKNTYGKKPKNNQQQEKEWYEEAYEASNGITDITKSVADMLKMK